jgi:hypothetical protein
MTIKCRARGEPLLEFLQINTPLNFKRDAQFEKKQLLGQIDTNLELTKTPPTHPPTHPKKNVLCVIESESPLQQSNRM